MDAAGGLGGGRAGPETAAKVAELEALQEEAAIAQRLAALQGGGKGAAAAPAAGKGGRSKPRVQGAAPAKQVERASPSPALRGRRRNARSQPSLHSGQVPRTSITGRSGVKPV